MKLFNRQRPRYDNFTIPPMRDKPQPGRTVLPDKVESGTGNWILDYQRKIEEGRNRN